MTNPTVQHIAIDTGHGVAIMQFVTKSEAFEREATDEAIALEVSRHGFAGRNWLRISPSDIPHDRSSRDTWRLEGKKIVLR